MRKILYSFGILLIALPLTACSPQTSPKDRKPDTAEKAISPPSSSPEKTTEETRENQTTESTQSLEMNLEQIAQGDYSSIVGTWRNNRGYTFEITPDSISQNGQTLTLSVLYGGIRDDILQVGAGSFGISFVPKGISVLSGSTDTDNLTDVSDLSRDRLTAGQNISDGSDAYYRVSE